MIASLVTRSDLAFHLVPVRNHRRGIGQPGSRSWTVAGLASAMVNLARASADSEFGVALVSQDTCRRVRPG